MKIRTKIILAVSIGIIPVVIVGIATVIGLRVISGHLVTEIALVKQTDTTSRLNSLALFIRYYDEVLTQSARNYAFTGNKVWRDRYNTEAPELDQFIKEAISLGDSEDKKIFSSINASNLALVAMEEDSMRLVDNGQKSSAIAVLDGTEYAKQKDIYQQGLVQYVAKRGKQLDDVLSASNIQLSDTSLIAQKAVSAGIFWVITGTIGVALFALLIALLTAHLVSSPIQILIQATKEIAGGNLNKKVDISSKDEIGDLAVNFNKMVEEIRKAKSNIENQVAARTKELEKTNQHLIGRELKMIELKKEIERLKNEK